MSITNQLYIAKLNQRFAHLTKEPRSTGVVFSEESNVADSNREEGYKKPIDDDDNY